MSISVPFDLTGCRRFFAEPATPRQRQYEALRAFFMEGLASAEVARRFGYSPAAFRMLCYDFRRGELPDFFALTRPGPREQPKKSLAREQVVALRKRNYSIYDISKAQAAGNAAERHRGTRDPGRGGLCSSATPARRGAPGICWAHHGGRGRCPQLHARPARVHHKGRRAIPIRPRSDPSGWRRAGSDRQTAWLSHDSCRTRTTRRAGAQAVVDRAQEPRHGAGG